METVIRDPSIRAVKIGAGKSAGIDRFLSPTATFTLGIRANLGFGTKDVELQSRLAVGTVAWGLGFPAMWTMRLPSDSKLFKEAVEGTTLQKQQQEQKQ